MVQICYYINDAYLMSLIFLHLFVCCFFETGFYAAQAGFVAEAALKPLILWSSFLECWDYIWLPTHLASLFLYKEEKHLNF